ncbi:MAG TPA: bifunctional phosphoribosylaminoimidazolecarboxamide formyltransferase/IMP cyclohydrolase [Candidatus Omnitrophota bacterium]|nr:bifunctional phosphoribosylaminoimidazolecarboxamide formyltransferase/IMP cyclohydrolase [Candidatus Omnitrophota bacterium]
MLKVKRVLISVSDKKGIVPFAKGLQALGVDVLSTGGTAKQLKESGLSVTEVSDYTGFPEMLDGRVKTLHPKIHGGILALRQNPSHMEQVKKFNIGLIDMVVVNLYPFEAVTKRKNVSLEEAIENIDIGGPSMLRSAAKNFKNVAVICNPKRYGDILKELENNNGLLSDAVLYKLAIEAFEHTAHYDEIISGFLNQRLKGDSFSSLPKDLFLHFVKQQDLRYGENPHQEAAFYRDANTGFGLADLKQLHGKELSFNNILDLNAAVSFIKDFKDPVAVIVKHGNPTGLALEATLSKAYKAAWQCDPVSAYGGIIGLNRKVDKQTAGAIQKSGFMECIIAPGFDKDAFTLLSQKKNVRLVEINLGQLKEDAYDFKKVYGGVLLQGVDAKTVQSKDLKVVTKKKPAKEELQAMLFGWQAIKNVRSNAIILVKQRKVVGIGCGQTSRVESVNIAIQKAGREAKGSVLVSDAFLPHIDNVQLAAKAGIKAIIQPGGSVVDNDVIKEADKAKMTMVFTGIRHFKH